ncbi:haloacid dehalogenase [Lactobacillus nasalidis]|uniref:Haloacid dehalogenase n=1 Tax=Lactobacillus nasalidis TaxID=2797258 RepID=A0ABQ3W2N2_9LACO|nr:Cof-type HAD-IIB family hydrolase [Lactobacillus nasalidis]GHV96854.1 haloacid dehalogenase [Lactobacillus nasalidis]GHV99464.1 haloacid dehalogenase [Lactobacillus nasalidis]GHW00371.1 haloacid dehalogenase [Lactobacillus nasalidis]
MTIKMLAIDLDGTLLTDSKTILPGTYRALQEAKAAGIKIVLTSGRPLSGIKGYAEELDLSGSDQYAILFNGAVVQNLEGRVLISHELDFGDFNTLLHMQRLSDVNLDFETPERFYTLDKKISIRQQVDGAETRNQLWIQDRSDFKKDFAFAKAVYQGDDPDQIDRLWNRLPDWFFQTYAVVRSWPEVVEVGSLAASKGYAVSELASRLGLSNSEVMVFGDQGNDRSMFEIPDFNRVAMGNAIDEIKELADYVTDTNERDGIAKALRKLVL